MRLIVVLIIFAVSIVLGIIKYRAVYYSPPGKDIEGNDIDAKDNWGKLRGKSNAPWQWRFVEIWNHTLSFLFAGLIGYYLFLARLDPILQGGTLNASDFVLLILFSLCIFGWFPYLLKNITEGINVIFERILRN